MCIVLRDKNLEKVLGVPGKDPPLRPSWSRPRAIGITGFTEELQQSTACGRSEAFERWTYDCWRPVLGGRGGGSEQMLQGVVRDSLGCGIMGCVQTLGPLR